MVWSLVRHDDRTGIDESNEDHWRAHTWSAIIDSTLTQWVGAIPLCIPHCEALEKIPGMHCETSD